MHFQTTAPPTLTEDEISFFFNGDSDCLKRTFKQSDTQNAFVRPSESNDMPEVEDRGITLSMFPLTSSTRLSIIPC